MSFQWGGSCGTRTCNPLIKSDGVYRSSATKVNEALLLD